MIITVMFQSIPCHIHAKPSICYACFILRHTYIHAHPSAFLVPNFLKDSEEKG